MDNTIKTGEGQESTDNYQLSIASCPLKRIALFPGTFDPFTIGHESLAVSYTHLDVYKRQNIG